MNGSYDDLRAALRERVHIADLLHARGVNVRLNGRGGGTALCPFHDDHRPSLSIYRSRRDDTERFRCWSCGSRGDVFDFAQTLLDYPDHVATLRALAAEHHLPWPEQREAVSSDVLDRAAQFYADRLTAPVLRYLAGRGFPEAFVRQRRIGYAPVSSSRDLLVREIRSTTRSNRTHLIQQAIEAGLVVQDKAGGVRDFFASETHVLTPPEDLGPKGDLNDWMRIGAKGDPAVFRSILERALAMSPTPWALQIQRLPPDLAPWDLEDHAGVRELLCEIGHQGPLSRDAHLRLLAERYGVAPATLEEAARELAQNAETEL